MICLKIMVMIIGLCMMLYGIGQVIYCFCMVIKYKKLANKQRQQIYEKYGVWIDEEPLM